MDQDANIMVLGENDPPFYDSFSKQSVIARIHRSLAEIDDIVPNSPQRVHGLRRDIGIGEERTLLRGDRQTFRSR